MVAIRILQK